MSVAALSTSPLPDGKLSPLELTLSGVASGVITKTACAPFDRIRLLYQVQPMFSTSSSTPWKYASIGSSVRTITSEEGIRGLWRGNFANMARAAVVYGMKFATNDYVKQIISSSSGDGRLSLFDLMCAGATAGLVQKAGSYPLDLLSVRVALGVNRRLLVNEPPLPPTTASNSSSSRTISKSLVQSQRSSPVAAVVAVASSSSNTVSSSSSTCSTTTTTTRLMSSATGATTRCAIPCRHDRSVYPRCCSTPPPRSAAATDLRWPGSAPNSIYSIATSIYRSEGIAGYYKGFGPTLLTGVPYVMLQMTFFDLLRRHIRQFTIGPPPLPSQHHHSSNPSLGAIFLTSSLAGSFAGVAAQAVVFPGDTVRKRMMANGLGGAPRLYRNSLDCFRKVLALEGPRGFYSGLLPCVLRAVPSGAIQFGSYELCKAFVVGHHHR
eukprot:GHVS01007539.1.p1 GENE.GHVS01007539.1~~GHVS01007539.1.p1  ORF type:complete len:454 (-),score=86.40 GHVS01007539.1:363-1670(-)